MIRYIGFESFKLAIDYSSHDEGLFLIDEMENSMDISHIYTDSIHDF